MRSLRATGRGQSSMVSGIHTVTGESDAAAGSTVAAGFERAGRHQT